MHTLVFLDNTYPHPYQLSTLNEQAIGGTESSIIKTAVILSKRFKVIVAQKYRQQTHIEHSNLVFAPKSNIADYQPNIIVVLRKYPLLKELHQQFPNAKLFLWLHTYKNTEYAFKKIGLARTNATIICNSKTHKKDTRRLLNQTILARLFSFFTKNTQVEFCYNPVSMPDMVDAKRDQNKLLFFSSPNKGLPQIIQCFEFINRKLPDLKLYIANPGYKADENIKKNKNIIILGSLPHKEMMQQLSQSLCVFYPQNSFAETFGLIYAEANAYGTPVLAHDIGSAREILDNNNELIDASNYGEILDLIIQWQRKHPQVTYNTKFSDHEILKQWLKILHISNGAV